MKIAILLFCTLLSLCFSEMNACAPGERFHMGCSVCVCGDDGVSTECSNIFCGRERRDVRQGCKPGDSWKEDCNTCVCHANGQKACTYKACLGSGAQVVALPPH